MGGARGLNRGRAMNKLDDMAMAEELRHQLTHELRLPVEAVEYLSGLWNFIQVMDDVADEDAVGRSAFDKALAFALVDMQANPFYAKYQMRLLFAMQVMMMKWQASDLAERNGLADERSYMWRAGFYDVVMDVVCIVHGPDADMALKALSLYGESAAAYMAEFEQA